MPYTPGGYSWLVVSPEPKEKGRAPLTAQEQRDLEKECTTMERTLVRLEEKIHKYHALCKKYEKLAGSKRGDRMSEQMRELKAEIDRLSKELGKH